MDETLRSVAFLFPGVGDQYPQMARGLYESEPVFRAEVDRCAALLREKFGIDLIAAIYPGSAPEEAAPGAGIDLRRMLARDAGSRVSLAPLLVLAPSLLLELPSRVVPNLLVAEHRAREASALGVVRTIFTTAATLGA